MGKLHQLGKKSTRNVEKSGEDVIHHNSQKNHTIGRAGLQGVLSLLPTRKICTNSTLKTVKTPTQHDVSTTKKCFRIVLVTLEPLLRFLSDHHHPLALFGVCHENGASLPESHTPSVIRSFLL